MLPTTTAADLSSIKDQSTVGYGLEEGILLVLKEEEASKPSPLLDWLARNPQHAREVAEYLAGSREIRCSVAPPSESGSALGGLELRDEIGRGAMGVVYRAYDAELKREVAVKRMRSDVAGSDAEWARFQFEAEAVASLDHPAIVRVHAYGVEGASPYLVMPLMEGGSLAQRQRNLGPDHCLAPKEAAKLIRDIALGVHHAHQRGLLHRDLKPGNILFDAEGRPHIADFGLARRLDASNNLSASGSIAGTPSYMAPEQARGEKGLTTAVDIHALGAILYELLGGEPPFGTGELLPTLKRVIEQQAISVRKKRREVPENLEAVCMKCLEKRPSDRYRSAEDFANDLNRFLNGDAVEARPPGFWDWLRQVARMRPEPNPNYSWQVTTWLGALILIVHSIVFAMVLAEAPSILVAVTLLSFGVTVVAVLWWYMLRRFRHLPITERHSLCLAAGSVLCYFALIIAFVPFSFSTAARASLAIYPVLAAVGGMGIFTLGSTNWSRFLPIGIAIFGLIPAMVWWPILSPLLYGIPHAAVMWYWAYAKKVKFTQCPTDSQ